jgi:hypothetical protein
MLIQKLCQKIQELGRKENLRKCCFELLAELKAVIAIGLKHVEGEIDLLEVILLQNSDLGKRSTMSNKILDNGIGLWSHLVNHASKHSGRMGWGIYEVKTRIIRWHERHTASREAKETDPVPALVILNKVCIAKKFRSIASLLVKTHHLTPP